MVKTDDIVERFQEELLSKPEKERVEYLRQMGFSIQKTRVRQQAEIKVPTYNKISGNVTATASTSGKKAKRPARSLKSRTSVVGHAQAN